MVSLMITSLKLIFKILLPQGKEITEKDGSGALCIRRPWPGIARTIYGDHNRFLDTYFRPYQGQPNYLHYFSTILEYFVCLF